MQGMLTLKEAAKLLTGRGGRKPHTETLRRWITRGYAAPSGECVRLKACRVSGAWLMKREWVDDFARARLFGGLLPAG